MRTPLSFHSFRSASPRYASYRGLRGARPLPDSIPLRLTATPILARISMSSPAGLGCRPTRFRRINRAGAASTRCRIAIATSCTRFWKTRRSRSRAVRRIEQKIGDYYAACMDEKEIDAKGWTPLKPELDRIKAMEDKTGLTDTVVVCIATARRHSSALARGRMPRTRPL